MKKRLISNRLTALKTLAGSFALLALMVLVLSPSAHAALPANTQITNSATLNYNDGAGPQTATSSVTVTIALVQAQVAIVTGGNQSTQYTGDPTILNNTFDVTAAANGPDQYDLTPNLVSTVNATGAAVSLTSPASPAWIGATITLTGSTVTILNVPSDGTGPDAVVNYIGVGDTVVVSGEARTVSAVSDPGGSGTATITLGSALTGAPAAGVLVAERITVSVQVESGLITSSGTNIVVTKTLSVDQTTGTLAPVTSGNITDTYTSGLATFTKYVRNATIAVVGGGGALTFPGAGPTYYRTGVTAQTGEVLEYLIVVANTGTGSISSCVVTDILPVAYSTINTTPNNESDVASYLTAGSDSDAATWASPTLTVNVGTGATNVAGGSIIAGELVHVLYQVTVQ
jgi:uncharacterized repeat protein (TIGR01451 family)